VTTIVETKVMKTIVPQGTVRPIWYLATQPQLVLQSIACVMVLETALTALTKIPDAVN